MHPYLLFYGRLSDSELKRVLRDFNILVHEYQRLLNNMRFDIKRVIKDINDNTFESYEKAEYPSYNKLTKDFLLISFLPDPRFLYVEVTGQKLSIYIDKDHVQEDVIDLIHDVYDELNGHLFDKLDQSVYFNNLEVR